MIYFDNSATSRYKPNKMIQEMKKELKCSSNGGRASHNDAINTAIKISNARTFFCEKLNAYEIIFTKNTTEALNIVIFGTLHQGDHVISTVTEHNSVLRPLKLLEKEGLISLTLLNPDEKTYKIIPTHIERSIKRNTALIAINGVSNVTGVVQDIESIGNITKKYNIPFLLDGAQTLPSYKNRYEKYGYFLYGGRRS